MRWEFGLSDVMVSMFHGHRKKDSRGNSFDEGMEAMKVKNR